VSEGNGKMTKMIEYPKKVIKLQTWAILEGLCQQCINPTQKGICSCGGCEKYEKKINRLQKWMYKAERNKRRKS
jgi:hypothetical protein